MKMRDRGEREREYTLRCRGRFSLESQHNNGLLPLCVFVHVCLFVLYSLGMQIHTQLFRDSTFRSP